MRVAILTETRRSGRRLKRLIEQASPSLVGLVCLSKADLIRSPKICQTTEALFSTWNMPLFTDEEVNNYFPSLRTLYYVGGDTNYFSDPFKKSGIDIYSAIDENSLPVAEFVAAQVVLANKGFFQSQRVYKYPFFYLSYFYARRFTRCRPGNYRANVGIIGCGNVGLKVVQYLREYDLNILVCDPRLSEEQAGHLGVSLCDISYIFEHCDVISNHLPDNSKTYSMLNGNLFSLMKDTVVFINTGRGAQVDERDLVIAMRKRPYACALLDVTEKEPLRPWSRLFWAKNIYVTPHIAGSQSNEEMRLVESMISRYENA